jgi:YgiT-type zinc finger domain-containing protein
MKRCQQCGKPMKERTVADRFVGREFQVTVAGIPAAVCGSCGYQVVDADLMEEVEMFVLPLVAGNLGMRMLETSHLTVHLGDPTQPGALALASSPFRPIALADDTAPDATFLDAGARSLAEEAA